MADYPKDEQVEKNFGGKEEDAWGKWGGSHSRAVSQSSWQEEYFAVDQQLKKQVAFQYAISVRNSQGWNKGVCVWCGNRLAFFSSRRASR